MRCKRGHDGLLAGVLVCVAFSRLAMSVCREVWFARIVPRTCKVGGHHGIADVDGGALRGNLLLPGNAGVP
jgi:hypothetical protein